MAFFNNVLYCSDFIKNPDSDFKGTKFYASDSNTGTAKWSQEIADYLCHSLVVCKNHLYISTSSVYGYGLMASKLNAFNVSSGSKDWEIEIGDGYRTSIISAQGKLFVIKVGDKWNILGFESTTKAHN